MCGIFAYTGQRTDAAEIVFNGLKDLEYRGYDSWGVSVVQGGNIFVKKNAGKIGEYTTDGLPLGSLAIGHTRWATHGGVTDKNSHPHLDCNKKISVIHNGIFENYEKFKSKLLRKDHKFISETDTEVIAHLLESNLKNKSFLGAFVKTFKQMGGFNAIVAINSDEDGVLAAKNGSPIVVGFGDNENYLASDAAALLPHTNKVYFLKDGEMVRITKDKVVVTNIISGKKIPFKIQTLNWDQEQAKLGNYDFFMQKEIHEQSQTLLRIIRSDKKQIKKLARSIVKSGQIYLTGCGTASYAASLGSYLFSMFSGKDAEAIVASEFKYRHLKISKDSLFLAISQSGETMDLIETVKSIKEDGGKIASLTNVLGSTLDRMSESSIILNVGPEKAVASTKAFTAMLAYLLLISHETADTPKIGIENLKLGLKSSEGVLSKGSIRKIKKLARKLISTKNLFVIGRGLSYPVALEAALKIKEISYIHAEGLAGGELKHGPLALIEKGTPCIVFAPDDETYGDSMSAAMEIKARGGYIIGVGSKESNVFDFFVQVANAKEATIIPNTIFAQILAYFMAIIKNLDPDKPRNLAKSVTVK